MAVLTLVMGASAAVPDIIVQIEQAALLETPLMRADTLFSTAELVSDRDVRKRLILEGLIALRSVRNEEARGFYLSAAAELMAPVDIEEALRLAREAPVRQAAAWQADYRGRAFTALARNKPELVEEALQSGAFHVPAAVGRPELFPILLRNFPGARARLQDVELLLDAAEKMDPAHASAAVDAALTASGTPADYEAALIGDVVLEGGMKRAIRIRIAQFVHRVLPEQWPRWSASLEGLEDLPADRPEIRIQRLAESNLEEQLMEKGAQGEYIDAVMRRHCVETDFLQHRVCAEAAQTLVNKLRHDGIRREDIGLRNSSVAARWLVAELEEISAR